MIFAIMIAVFGISAFVFAGLSTNTKSKALEILFTAVACVCLLCFGVATVFADNEQDKAFAAEIETSEGEQILETTPADTATNITITAESLTNEQLIKMFIDKWDGVLPDTINITIGDKND